MRKQEWSRSLVHVPPANGKRCCSCWSISPEQSNESIAGRESSRTAARRRPSGLPLYPAHCRPSLLRVRRHYGSRKHVETEAPHLAKRSLNHKAAMRCWSPWRAGGVWGVIQTFAKPVSPLNLPGCLVFTVGFANPPTPKNNNMASGKMSSRWRVDILFGSQLASGVDINLRWNFIKPNCADEGVQRESGGTVRRSWNKDLSCEFMDKIMPVSESSSIIRHLI